MTDRKDINVAGLRKQLEDRRSELLAHSSHDEDYHKPVDVDLQAVGRFSRGDALQEQEMHLEQERRRVAELERIEKTLGQIDGDDFGYCQNCGEAIEKKRLEFDPTTPLCVDCASKAEHV
ncbi:TraR/DksA C4-type zinc finger protein [Thalassospira sp. MA62]|nr:TraR/DksA C4-type zinc finger protein [Thalassospira sp. MA62]